MKGKQTPTRPSRPRKAQLTVAPGAILITTDKAGLEKKIQECIKQSGRVNFRFEEVAATKLGQTIDMEVIVN